MCMQIVSGSACCLALALGGAALAAPAADPAPLVLSACDNAAAWNGGTLAAGLPQAGRGAIRWAHGRDARLSLRDVPSDWSRHNTLEIALESLKATGSRFLVYIGSENPATEGADYYSAMIALDFTGRRTFVLPFSEMDIARSPLGWDRISDLSFTAAGWGNTPHPEAEVVLGNVRLTWTNAGFGPRLRDEDFFAALDLDLPALAEVRAAAAAEDWAGARQAFARHLRDRETPHWHFDWRERPHHAEPPDGVDTREADRVVAHLLTSVGVPHQFGPDIDWSINPTPLKYNEWTWQLSRHPFWSTLGRAYWATGDEVYAREFVAQITDWITDNPVPVNQSGNRAGSRWRTIETGIRMFSSWPDCFFRFLSSPSFSDDSVVLMVKSMVEHARHLLAHPTGNNWLAMEMNGLFHVGVLFPEFRESGSWRETAGRRLHEELNNQVYPDGAQVELATGYHGVSLHNFVGTLRLAERNGIALPGDYAARMEKMYDYYLKLVMPDGCMPALNDAGWGDCRKPLREGAERFPERTDFLAVASGGQEGRLPAFTSTCFPYAGWAVMRTGWGPEDLYCHFEYGPFGAAHQHEDKLSLILHAHGRRLLTEGGVYAYDSSPWRRYILSSRSHNTILVDGLEQNRRGLRETYLTREPLPNRWISRPEFDFAEGWYDEGYGPDRERTVTHRRAVLLVKPEYWLVIDRLTPSDTASHRYEVLFHLDGENAEAGTSPMRVWGTDPGLPNLAIVALNPEGLTLDIVKGREEPTVQGWVPAGGYAMRPVATPVFRAEGAGERLLPWLLFPLAPGRDLPVKETSFASDDGEALATIDFTDGRRHLLRIPLTAPPPGTTGNLHWSCLAAGRSAAEIRIGE
ncbi:MAG: alginate lyase family protein [Lentisphaeria bacterium]|nr:alginate lyase family protein [Lentisphaeria bacterium]